MRRFLFLGTLCVGAMMACKARDRSAGAGVKEIPTGAGEAWANSSYTDEEAQNPSLFNSRDFQAKGGDNTRARYQEMLADKVAVGEAESVDQSVVAQDVAAIQREGATQEVSDFMQVRRRRRNQQVSFVTTCKSRLEFFRRRDAQCGCGGSDAYNTFTADWNNIEEAKGFCDNPDAEIIDYEIEQLSGAGDGDCIEGRTIGINNHGDLLVAGGCWARVTIWYEVPNDWVNVSPPGGRQDPNVNPCNQACGFGDGRRPRLRRDQPLCKSRETSRGKTLVYNEAIQHDHQRGRPLINILGALVEASNRAGWMCYSGGQVRDNDSTDLVTECFCGSR